MNLSSNRLSVWLLGAAFVFCMLLASPAKAGPVVTGSVSFNAATGIYTYSYTLDNTAGTGTIVGFDLEYSSLAFTYLQPLSYTSAPDWGFGLASGVAFGGTWWAWNPLGPPFGPPGVPPGESLSGFSVQTTVAPSTSTANDYFVAEGNCNYGSSNCVFVFGNVVAPNYVPSPPPPPVPEPSTALLLVTGFVGVLVSAFRQR
jgi:hypothetical protein